jgi:hydrogenase nickel incorporation protein HypA/HybF
MHELSIAMSILDGAEEEAENRGGGRLSAIYVKVGSLSGVVPDALLAAYELARENTSMSDCRLVVEKVQGPDLLVSALEFAP